MQQIAIPLSSMTYSERARYHLRGKWCFCGCISTSFFILVLLSGVFKSHILSLALIAPFEVWNRMIYLRVARGEQPRISDFKLGWGLQLKAMLVSMSYNIMIYYCSFLLIVPGIYVGMAFSQAIFIFIENPDLSVKDTFYASYLLMKKRKMKLLMQTFSFVGWLLLTIISMGLLSIWLAPYYYTTLAQFYMGIKKETEEDPHLN